MIHDGQIDLVAPDTTLDLVDIPEVILVAFGMELSPRGCRAGQVDHSPDFDIFRPDLVADGQGDETDDHDQNAQIRKSSTHDASSFGFGFTFLNNSLTDH